MKKRVALYLTDSMHQELKDQAESLGLDMGSYVVHLLMREKDRTKNEKVVRDLLETTKQVIKDPKIFKEL